MKTNITSPSKDHPLSVLRSPFVILFLFFLCAQASAQVASANKTITGTVKFSEDNEPAPGVNIYLKGATAQGTYSDAKGQFVFPLQLKSGDVLVFSFIGRETVEYVVTDQVSGIVDVVMGPDSIEMVEDVLVEGDDSRHSVFARVFRRTKATHK
jgi:hypothetical protein